MFANLLQLIGRHPPPNLGPGFVEEVRLNQRSPRNLRTERIILGGWILILGKSFLMLWLVEKYHMSFNPNWVIVPTVIAALLCTAAYFFRD